VSRCPAVSFSRQKPGSSESAHLLAVLTNSSAFPSCILGSSVELAISARFASGLTNKVPTFTSVPKAGVQFLPARQFTRSFCVTLNTAHFRRRLVQMSHAILHSRGGAHARVHPKLLSVLRQDWMASPKSMDTESRKHRPNEQQFLLKAPLVQPPHWSAPA
jgi:hypothetical protein